MYLVYEFERKCKQSNIYIDLTTSAGCRGRGFDPAW